MAGIALASVASTAFAGGLDRATFSSSILFEKGSYAEISHASTSPTIEATSFLRGPLPGGLDPAQTFHTTQWAYKADINDKVAIAFAFNNNPYGVDVNYAAFAPTGLPFSSLSANLSSTALTLSGKYKLTDRVSAFAGLKYQSITGSANVSVPIGAAIASGDVTSIAPGDLAAGAGIVSLDSDSAIAPIIGVSYEIEKIALRVAASYEFGSETNPTVRSVNPTFAAAAGSIKTPDVLLLEFQSGVAENTLVFGSIRHAKWGDAQVTMSSTYDNLQLSDFSDSTTYSIGVGRKFSDSFSASLSLTHAPSSCVDVSLLAPTCENNTLSIGGKYSVGNGAAISGGVSFRKYKTATGKATQGGVVFDGSTLTTVGLKLSKSF